ncbi:hypothetical protein IHV25_02500 [Phaeovibrio sulfidiphilus]|uniref:Uncharacterized protein n=1 Tax=Phaeovibrio sulfidiphilus TaxID=1220600 RepID=A0A8J6YVJ4_9PROT|nr:hypothetical protein [Phaeovibrio sulfidiphilus]MBE1236522.1 hypothetical protein [Phaeovibrio sulfidiphilus]
MLFLGAGLCLLTVVLSTFALAAGAHVLVTWLSGGAFLVYLGLMFPRVSRTTRVLLLIATLLGIVGFATGGMTTSAFREALGTSAFMGALFTCFGTLRDAASSSLLMQRAGTFLASRPPGQRYGALSAGSHLFGLILNFSTISLLGTLVHEGTRAADGDPNDERTRKAAFLRRHMAQAIHRGFSTTTIWCPLTICIAVIFTALPETTWVRTLPWLLGVTATFLLSGWLLDRLSHRTPAGANGSGSGTGASNGNGNVSGLDTGTPGETPGSWWLLLAIVGLVVVIFSSGWFVEEMLDVRLVLGVMIVCPFFALGWILIQGVPARGLSGALSETGRRAEHHLRNAFPKYANELGIIGGSTLIALVTAAALPDTWVPAVIHWLDLPPWVLIAAVPWLAILLGQVGMSPLLSVALIASTMPTPAHLGLNPETMAVAYAGAWSLVTSTSPYTAALLLSSGLASTRSTTVTPFQFGPIANGPYTLVNLLALDGLIAFMELSGVLSGAPAA